MDKRKKNLLITALFIIGIMCVFPPWYQEKKQIFSEKMYTEHLGYDFVITGSGVYPGMFNSSPRIDIEKLLTQIAAIVFIFGAIMLLGDNAIHRIKKASIYFAIIGVGTFIVIGSYAFVTSSGPFEDKKASGKWTPVDFDPFKKDNKPVTVTLPKVGAIKFPSGMNKAEIISVLISYRNNPEKSGSLEVQFKKFKDQHHDYIDIIKKRVSLALSRQQTFDYDGTRKAGYSDAEIASHLSKKERSHSP